MAHARRLVRRSDYMEKYHALTRTDGVPFFPYGVWKDVVFSGVILLVIAACAMYFVLSARADNPIRV